MVIGSAVICRMIRKATRISSSKCLTAQSNSAVEEVLIDPQY